MARSRKHPPRPSSENFVSQKQLLAQIERTARFYLVRQKGCTDADLLSQAIAEGIARMLERYPQWETIPTKQLLKTVVGTASNWLRDYDDLVALSNLFTDCDDPDSEMETARGSTAFDPSDLVASRHDLLWLLSHFPPEDVLIVLARWLDFRYEEISLLLSRNADAVRQQHHRVACRMIDILQRCGYITAAPIPRKRRWQRHH